MYQKNPSFRLTITLAEFSGHIESEVVYNRFISRFQDFRKILTYTNFRNPVSQQLYSENKDTIGNSGIFAEINAQQVMMFMKIRSSYIAQYFNSLLMIIKMP